MRRSNRSLICAVLVLAPFAVMGCTGGEQPRAWGPTRGESGWHAGASEGVLVSTQESRPKFVRMRSVNESGAGHMATVTEGQ